jgi:copper chaperone CopZ
MRVGGQEMSQLKFKVVGEQAINCSGCEQRIDNALQRLDGVQKVEASFQTQEVTVEIDDSKLTPGQVRTKLDQLGYEAAFAEETV